MMAVEEDKLTWHDDHTLCRVAAKELIAVEEQLDELAGIRCCRCVAELALRVEVDTSLSGVGDDETHLGLLSQSHKGLILSVWVQSAADDIDTSQGINRLTVLLALEIDVIEAVLTVEPVDHTAVDRLHNNNA